MVKTSGKIAIFLGIMLFIIIMVFIFSNPTKQQIIEYAGQCDFASSGGPEACLASGYHYNNSYCDNYLNKCYKVCVVDCPSCHDPLWSDRIYSCEYLDCIPQEEKCVGIDYYYCDAGRWIIETASSKCPGECEYIGQEKCDGNNVFYCALKTIDGVSNYVWEFEGLFVGKCDYTCILGNTKCDGTNYSVCEVNPAINSIIINVWSNKGQVEGKCEYNLSCNEGELYCIDTESFICSNGIWNSQGYINGQCGYVIPITPPEIPPEEEKTFWERCVNVINKIINFLRGLFN